jgi:hypothetical protein
MEGVMQNEAIYSRRGLLAGMQMLEWTQVQMYVHGVGPEGQKRARMDRDPEAIRGIELIELMNRVGHHRFRDMIADLVPAHVEGEQLGIATAGPTTLSGRNAS